MLSYTCKTAIKAVIYIATQSNKQQKSSIKDVALNINASEHTVGKILQSLVKQGIINSLKGPSGGFYIVALQEQRPIMDIVNAIDGHEVFKGCGLGLSKCSATHPCPIHNQYQVARELIEKLFRTSKIADLTAPIEAGLAHLVG
ncbi:MAG: Rrf2 family transcriptional regulator [Bacteroidetes bacterium]|nr:Rrf2 family transcriptional regulator [Bacteroidota bacterium]